MTESLHDILTATSRLAETLVDSEAERMRDEAVELHRALRGRLEAELSGFGWATLDERELASMVARDGHKGARALLALRDQHDRTAPAIGAALATADRAVILGKAGLGKTSLACAVLRQHLEARRRGAFVPAWRLAMARARSPLGSEAPMVTRAVETDLLVLDDLGAEPPHPTSAVAEVIYERDLARRRTIVTLACEPAELAKKYGDGIARRVGEDALVVKLGGAPRRG